MGGRGPDVAPPAPGSRARLPARILRRLLIQTRLDLSIDWEPVRRDPRALLWSVAGTLLATLSCLAAGAAVRAHVDRRVWLWRGWVALWPSEHVETSRLRAGVVGGTVLVIAGVALWARVRYYRARRIPTVGAICFTAGVLANGLELLVRGSVTDYLWLHRVAVADLADLVTAAGAVTLIVVIASPRDLFPQYRTLAGLVLAPVAPAILIGWLWGDLTRSLFALAVLGVAGLTWAGLRMHWLATGGHGARRAVASISRERLDADPAGAVADLEHALATVRGRDLGSTGRVLSTLSWSYVHLRRPADIRRTSEELLEVSRRLDNPAGQLLALHRLGYADAISGHPARARARWREALELAGRAGDDAERLRLLKGIAILEATVGQKVPSRRAFEAAIELANSTGQASVARDLRREMFETLKLQPPPSMQARVTRSVRK